MDADPDNLKTVSVDTLEHLDPLRIVELEFGNGPEFWAITAPSDKEDAVFGVGIDWQRKVVENGVKISPATRVQVYDRAKELGIHFRQIVRRR